MANYCDYHVIVKGPKNACYAVYGSMPCMDDKWIEEEHGTEEDYYLRLSGNCKWAVDAYTAKQKGLKKLKLPKDPEEAYTVGNDYWGIPQFQKAKLFGVEFICNSADVEDWYPEYYDECGGIYEHYDNKGKKIDDKCPKELYIQPDWMEDDYEE